MGNLTCMEKNEEQSVSRYIVVFCYFSEHSLNTSVRSRFSEKDISPAVEINRKITFRNTVFNSLIAKLKLKRISYWKYKQTIKSRVLISYLLKTEILLVTVIDKLI